MIRLVLVFWIAPLTLPSPRNRERGHTKSAFLAILGFLIISTTIRAEESDSPPNIIFVMVDDMGIGNVGCYGSQAVLTPNLDRMAREGMRFTQAYSGCTVCAPARSVLLTGMHMGHTSVRVNTGGVPLLDGDVTIAEALKTKGYVCGGFGKWGLGDLDTEGAPERQGFDTFFGFYHQYHAHLTFPEYLIDTGNKIPYPGNAGFNLPFGGERPKPGFTPKINPKTDESLQYAHYQVFDRMKQFIRENHEESFFCYAPWTPPHGRYHIPESDPATEPYVDKPWSDESKAFAAMCTMVDRQMGELFELLKELEIDDNTIVFFCSDHGAAFRSEGELDSCGPYRGFKRSMYEGGLLVPMIVRWPGNIRSNSQSNHVCYFGDVFQTLCDVADVTEGIPDQLDSLSFLPTLLFKPGQEQHDFLLWHWSRFNARNNRYGDSMSALRRGNWKIVRSSAKDPWELYDLSSDPYEGTNLAESRSKVVDELAELFQANMVEGREPREPEKPEGAWYR